MAIDVQIYSILKKDYTLVAKQFQSEYLQVSPDYLTRIKDIVELFLTNDEITDLENKLYSL